MRVLFDQGTPVPLRQALRTHQVSTAHEMGWSLLKNGDLLKEAERGFDALVTTDQNLRYQQHLVSRNVAILVLMTTSWPVIRAHVANVVAALEALKPGEYVELSFTP